MDKTLRYAAYAGIVSMSLWLIKFTEIFEGKGFFISILLRTGILLSIVIFYWGLKSLGEKTQNRIMKNTAYVAIIWMTISFLLWLISEETSLIDSYLSHNIFVVLSIIEGFIAVAFGVAFLELRKRYGSIATATAITGISSGVFMATSILTLDPIKEIVTEGSVIESIRIIIGLIVIAGFLLSAIGLLLSRILIVLGVVILYKASKEF